MDNDDAFLGGACVMIIGRIVDEECYDILVPCGVLWDIASYTDVAKKLLQHCGGGEEKVGN